MRKLIKFGVIKGTKEKPKEVELKLLNGCDRISYKKDMEVVKYDEKINA